MVSYGFLVNMCIDILFPAYEWYKQRGTLNEKVDPSTDSRYTFINGRLVIDSPSSERADDGRYQCAATNIYGTILSNQVELAFGCKWNSFSP